MGEDLQVGTNQGDTPDTVITQPKETVNVTPRKGGNPNFVERAVEKATFLGWLLLKDKERVERGLPRTQKDLAEQLDVREATLSEWKALPTFKQQFRDGISNRVLYDLGIKIAEVNDVLLDKALKGRSLKAIELIYKILGQTPKDGPVVEVNQNQSLTLAQALKENGESLEPPSWMVRDVIDVPSETLGEAPTEPVELEVEGEEDVSR